MEYNDGLRGIKGYTNKTIEVYSKYAFELEVNGNDGSKLIKVYENKSNSTKRLVLSAVKSYYTFMNDKRAKEIELPKKRVVESDFVTMDEYKKYISYINKRTKMGFQKYIILRLLFETGIRASELLWITKTNIHNNRIKIYGKGNKERYILISKGLESELKEYCESVMGERLFDFGYKNLYQKIRILDKKRHLNPHMFRRGYAKYCFENGISIYDISISMGHSSIETTTKYIHKKSEDVKIFTIF